MIKEVKKILKDNDKLRTALMYLYQWDRAKCDKFFADIAQQICQLFPKTKDNPDGYEPKFNNALEADAHNWDTRELHEGRPDRPSVVCLCGSTRFVDTFNEWRKRLTLEGKIVVSIELVLPQSEREDPQHSNFKVKQALDELHLRKIDLADEVFVIKKDGYIGESTSKEIAYAQKLGKSIKYMEEQNAKA